MQLCVKFTHWGHSSWKPKSSNHFTFSGAKQPTIAPLSHSSKEEKKMKRKAKEEELQPGLWSRLNKSHVTYSPNDSCLWFLYKFSGGLLSSQLRLINIPLRLSWWFGIYCFTYSISLNVFVWCDFLGVPEIYRGFIANHHLEHIWSGFVLVFCRPNSTEMDNFILFSPAGSHCSLDVSGCVWIEESHEAKHEQRWKEESLWLYKAWLLDWMIVWLYIHWFIHSFVHSLMDSFIDGFIALDCYIFTCNMYDWFLWFSLREDWRSLPPCKLPVKESYGHRIMESPAGSPRALTTTSLGTEIEDSKRSARCKNFKPKWRKRKKPWRNRRSFLLEKNDDSRWFTMHIISTWRMIPVSMWVTPI